MVLGKDWAKVREVWIMVGQGFGWVWVKVGATGWVRVGLRVCIRVWARVCVRV